MNDFHCSYTVSQMRKVRKDEERRQEDDICQESSGIPAIAAATLFSWRLFHLDEQSEADWTEQRLVSVFTFVRTQ